MLIESKPQFSSSPINILELPADLKFVSSKHHPSFIRVPKYYWQQTTIEKIICFFLTVLSIGVAAVFTFGLVNWTMNTSSTTFAYIWTWIAIFVFVAITVINSFTKPPAPSQNWSNNEIQMESKSNLQQNPSFIKQQRSEIYFIKMQ